MTQSLVKATLFFLLLISCKKSCFQEKNGSTFSNPTGSVEKDIYRTWFCPHCSHFNTKFYYYCEHCPRKRHFTGDWLSQERKALIKYIKDTSRQVSGNSWNDFFTRQDQRNWVCNTCRHYNKESRLICNECISSRRGNQADREQSSLIASLNDILSELQQRGDDLPFSERGAFMQRVANLIKRLEEDKDRSDTASRYRRLAALQAMRTLQRQQLEETLGENLEEALDGMNPDHFASLQEYLLASHADRQRNQQPATQIPAAEVTVHPAWICNETPEENNALKETCPVCKEDDAFKDNGACKCPHCKQLFCQDCYKKIIRAAGQVQVYDYGSEFGALYRTKMRCPLCCEEIPLN